MHICTQWIRHESILNMNLLSAVEICKIMWSYGDDGTQKQYKVFKGFCRELMGKTRRAFYSLLHSPRIFQENCMCCKTI